MKKLTVFTPAYNRAHTINRTYESLCRQTNDDFEWLIVNDGSSDKTENLVESWLQSGFKEYQTERDGRLYEHKDGFSKDNGFRIHYVYQQNQGMHGAHNTAYHYIETELNTCIDSDDYIELTYVEKLYSNALGMVIILSMYIKPLSLMVKLLTKSYASNLSSKRSVR